MFSSEAWLAKSGADFYNGQVTNSLRLNQGDSMTRAFGTSPTSSTTMSFGGWCKFTGQHYMNLFSATLGGSGVPQSFITINGDLKILLQSWTGSANIFHYISTRVIRDTSAWMHLWVQIDTTDGTASDRVKLYVNGVRETVFDTEVNPSSGVTVVGFNQNYTHYFGHTNASYGIGAYLADWWFLDGQDVSPVDTVGEFKNGVFIPKEYSSPTFGNKGFHLEFKQSGVGTASTSTIGADTSGNNNHWTSSGIVASDCAMIDSPENNFCIINANDKTRFGANQVQPLSEGNLKVGQPPSYDAHTIATMSLTSILLNGDDVYFEARIDGGVSNNTYFGIIAGHEDNSASGSAIASYSFPYIFSIDVLRGYIYTNSGSTSSQNYTSIITYSANDIIGFSIKSDGKVFVHKNGTYFNNINGSAQNPATGANPIYTLDTTKDWFPYTGGQSAVHFNFGQDDTYSGAISSGGNSGGNSIGTFKHAPPSSTYLALCTANLPEPTISPNADTQADDHFNTVLYTANDQQAKTVTGMGFKPDWLWIKGRSYSDHHYLIDSSRGINKFFRSSGTDSETTNTTMVTAVNNDGFVLGTDDVNWVNYGTNTMVSWGWKVNGGTTSSNSDGSITSTVQANTTSGFSIVTYTGNGTNNSDITIGHSLGVTPRMVIVKNRTDANRWQVYHEDLSADGSYTKKNIVLNSSSAESGYSSQIKAVSSTTFTVRDADANGNANVNKNNSNYVAYCFASIEGYSKFGSYTGNGNADGTFVYTGFRPSFLMLKNTNTSNSWRMWVDDGDGNVEKNGVYPDSSSAEDTPTNWYVDWLSNGFKIRASQGEANGSGNTFIYMAFAEQPFKYANAR